MPKNTQPTEPEGILNLLAEEPPPAPSAEADPPQEETILERQTRQAQQRQAALAVLTMVEKEQSEVDLSTLAAEITIAEQRQTEAQLQLQAANKAVEESRSRVDKLRAKMIRASRQGEAQANAEYLELQKKERFDRANRIMQRNEFLSRANVLTDDEMRTLGLGLSAIDQGIAQRVVAARRQGK